MNIGEGRQINQKYASDICKYISIFVLVKNFELIRNLKRCLSCCFDCPYATAMWSRCDGLAIAPAKNAKQNKTKENVFWGCT